MGTLFSSCAKGKDSECSLPNLKEGSLKREAKTKTKKKGRSCKSKSSRKNLETSKTRDKLSLTSMESFGNVSTSGECLGKGLQTTVDLTVVGQAVPIPEKPMTPKIELGGSNARVIAVQPSTTSEHSSEETFQCGGLKRPMTGSESNASLSSPAGVEGAKNSGDNDSLGHDEESSNVAPRSQASEDQDVPVRSSHFQLLDLLRIRLDMAANNMEINRLLANVDRALDRTARIRELGFRRIMAARKSRRVHSVIDVKENTRSNGEEAYADGDETGTDEEESVIEGEKSGSGGHETDGDDESDEFEGSEIPPPLRPRICWQ